MGRLTQEVPGELQIDKYRRKGMHFGVETEDQGERREEKAAVGTQTKKSCQENGEPLKSSRERDDQSGLRKDHNCCSRGGVM